MKSKISQTLGRVRAYTPVQGGYHSDSARKASNRNFQIRALKHSLNVLINLKAEEGLKDTSPTDIEELIIAQVDIINELILIGNPTIKRKLIIENKKAWADGRRVWAFGQYGCLQSIRYANVKDAQDMEEEINKRMKGKKE